MAEPTTNEVKAVDETPFDLRQRGAETVRALNEVSAQLHPLQQKQAAGEPLSDDDVQRLAGLEIQYRDLELRLRQLMRPRPRHAWLTGRDHLHGPDHERDSE